MDNRIGSVLVLILFVLLATYGIKGINRQEDSLTCNVGVELNQENTLIGCLHSDGYISSPVYGNPVTGLEAIASIAGLLGTFIIGFITVIIFIEKLMR
jgi:hypothetical protein